MSLITINTVIAEITAITNIKILNAKSSKIEVSMKTSTSFLLSKVLCCSLKLNFLAYTSQLILSMFLEQTIILCQSHLTPMILVKYAPVMLYYGKLECPMYLLFHQNNLKMLCWPRSTFPNLHYCFLDHMLQ